jgi:hypothetical protein
MPAARIKTALVLGAITRDLEAGRPTAPGGVVHYAGRAFAALGARTRVVPRVREADAELLAPLLEARRALREPATTTYATTTRRRGSTRAARGLDPIAPDDLPTASAPSDPPGPCTGATPARDAQPVTSRASICRPGALADEHGTRLA